MTIAHEACFAIFEGFVVSLLVVLAMWFAMPVGVLDHNPVNQFSRRFDGGCNGWSTQLAVCDMLQNIGLWIVYCTMAVVLYRLHPLPTRDVPTAKLTLNLMVAFIVGCGFKHLVDAYTTMVPVYRVAIVIGYIVVVVSAAALWFIAVSLQTAKLRTIQNRLALESFVSREQ